MLSSNVPQFQHHVREWYGGDVLADGGDNGLGPSCGVGKVQFLDLFEQRLWLDVSCDWEIGE